MNTTPCTVQELQQLRQQHAPFLLLDVREPAEYAICNLGGTLIPLGELPTRHQELDKDQTIIVHCHFGGRSQQAVDFLLRQGFTKVRNLSGGIDAWAVHIEPTMPRY